MKYIIKKKVFIILFSLIFTLGLGLFLREIYPKGISLSLLHHKFTEIFYFPIVELFQTIVFSWAFWTAIAVTLVFERLMPAKANQKLFSVSFFQDIVWFFYETILAAVILATYVSFLTAVYGHYFEEYLTITAVNDFPMWVRFLIALFLTDFLYWLQHYINHKVPLFWQFHLIHHSQKEINFFTDFRYHILEYITRQTILTVPFLILQFDAPEIVAISIVLTWYTRFYHGNIKANLGPLKYILVTPQSHRVHHSKELKHWDKNFGSIFAIWDFIFRTQWMGFEEYPETGIDHPDFPHEENTNLASLVLLPFRQMIYPFKVIKKKWFN